MLLHDHPEDGRIEALETKLAFQEDALQALSDALVAQQSRMDRLERRLEQQAEQLRDAAQDQPAQVEPPPPHY